MGASVLDTARQADEATLARYMIRCSLHTPHVERLSTAEMVAGGCGLGSCCGSSSLWCARCADNFLWSGCDREVADNIHTLKWLPPADAVHRQRPGKLEAALALVERVAARLKPLGQLILDELCEDEGVGDGRRDERQCEHDLGGLRRGRHGVLHLVQAQGGAGEAARAE